MSQEQILKTVEDLIHDTKAMIAHADQYHTDVDRGINSNATLEDEGYSKSKKIENLLDYLIDAKHDIDRLRDEMKALKGNLESLHREIEWNNLSSALYSK